MRVWVCGGGASGDQIENCVKSVCCGVERERGRGGKARGERESERQREGAREREDRNRLSNTCVTRQRIQKSINND